MKRRELLASIVAVPVLGPVIARLLPKAKATFEHGYLFAYQMPMWDHYVVGFVPELDRNGQASLWPQHWDGGRFVMAHRDGSYECYWYERGAGISPVTSDPPFVPRNIHEAVAWLTADERWIHVPIRRWALHPVGYFLERGA